jgi:tetratricopeptide (TPR) repeat protein
MPAHIYMRTGDYLSAVSSNAKAAEVDRAYIAASKPAGIYPAMYYNHNLDFLASAAMMAGQFATAKKAADELVTNVTPALAEMAMLEPFAAKTLFVMLRFARWDDVLRLPAADAKFPLLVTLSHFGRGIAHAARGNLAEAERERGVYVNARKAIKPESDWGFNKAKSMLEVTDAVLDAWIARARRDDAAAIDAWRIAVIKEDMLNYNEPPDWFYPSRESLGAALLRAKRFREADQAFRDDLTRNPKNGRSLYGLWQTMLASRRVSEKQAVDAAEKQFREAWKRADVMLKIEEM